MVNTCFATTEYYHVIALYSHFVPLILTLLVSAFVLIKSKYSLITKVFALFSVSFSLWLLGDVITWTSSNYDLVVATWAPLDYINIIFYLVGAYFFIVLVRGRDTSIWEKLLLLSPAAPAWWITFSNNSVSYLNEPVCEAINNEFLSNYKLGVEVLVMAFIMFYALFSLRKKQRSKQWQLVIVAFALILFFSVFSTTEYIASQTGIYEMNLYSLFILPIFLFIIIYSITNLEIFKIHLIGTQLLAYVLVVMVGSQFFFLDNTTDKTITIITFVLSLGFGILLIRSGIREAAAREKIEKLATELANTNAQLRELDRQKDAVLHMVAHQLKGPVTTINYITEFLLDGTFGKLSDEQTENVTNIRNASQKMGAQSEMVLDAAKIKAGKLPFEPMPLDLAGVVKEAIGEATINAKKRGVNLKTTISPSLPTVILDRKYTQLVIDNLLSNAIKYTALRAENGNVEFTFEVKGDKIFCSVKDTGIGVPKSEQEHIFKELYRASNSGKEGNGLGLHVAKGAIEGQGGKMWFESEEGKGTTFYFELPLRKPADQKK